ncbi:hypothetical protein [Desulfoluna limicola]|uniref:hypothetical protein n=1 Tax=Desulfoluna limicola TaxID=2810562 RepID=UPI001F274E9E|nr:hypothetical protein [Desulfoluna limicola]
MPADRRVLVVGTPPNYVGGLTKARLEGDCLPCLPKEGLGIATLSLALDAPTGPVRIPTFRPLTPPLSGFASTSEKRDVSPESCRPPCDALPRARDLHLTKAVGGRVTLPPKGEDSRVFGHLLFCTHRCKRHLERRHRPETATSTGI